MHCPGGGGGVYRTPGRGAPCHGAVGTVLLGDGLAWMMPSPSQPRTSRGPVPVSRRGTGAAHARGAPAAAPRPRGARPLAELREGRGPPWWRGRCGRCWRRCGRAGASCRRAGTCTLTSSSRHPRSWQVRRAPGTGRPREGSRGRGAARPRAPCPAPAGVPRGSRSVTPRVPQTRHKRSRRAGRVGGWVGSCSVLPTASGASSHITVTRFSVLRKNEWYTPKNVKVDTSVKSLGAVLYCDAFYTK